jgi:hypothetical protein
LEIRRIFKENKLTVLDWELGHVQFIPVSEQNTLRKEIEDFKSGSEQQEIRSQKSEVRS